MAASQCIEFFSALKQIKGRAKFTKMREGEDASKGETATEESRVSG
jgi:hypothetical protein